MPIYALIKTVFGRYRRRISRILIVIDGDRQTFSSDRFDRRSHHIIVVRIVLVASLLKAHQYLDGCCICAFTAEKKRLVTGTIVLNSRKKCI